MNPIIAHELEAIQKAYSDAFTRLSRLTHSNRSEVRALVFRLLTSKVLMDAMGSSDRDGIGWGRDLGDPISRMHFVSWFVGHEILDDGMPIIQWHIRHENYKPCRRDDPGAIPYVHHSVEQYPEDYDIVDVDTIFKLLDWHEARNQHRIALAIHRQELLGRLMKKNPNLPPQSKVRPLISMMESLVADLNDSKNQITA